jgi:hypothetical protein
MRDESELINQIKAKGSELEALIAVVRVSLTVAMEESEEASDRIEAAEAFYWLSVARTNLQQGLMALTRAVVQPLGSPY